MKTFVSDEFLDQVRVEQQDTSSGFQTCEAPIAVSASSSLIAPDGLDTASESTTYTRSGTGTTGTFTNQITNTSLTSQVTSTPPTSATANTTTSRTAVPSPTSSTSTARHAASHGPGTEVTAIVLGITIGLGLAALIFYKILRRRVADTQGGFWLIQRRGIGRWQQRQRW